MFLNEKETQIIAFGMRDLKKMISMRLSFWFLIESNSTYDYWIVSYIENDLLRNVFQENFPIFLKDDIHIHRNYKIHIWEQVFHVDCVPFHYTKTIIILNKVHIKNSKSVLIILKITMIIFITSIFISKASSDYRKEFIIIAMSLSRLFLCFIKLSCKQLEKDYCYI